MKREEIVKELKSLCAKLSQDLYPIVIGESSLVLQEILDETSSINLVVRDKLQYRKLKSLMEVIEEEETEDWFYAEKKTVGLPSAYELTKPHFEFIRCKINSLEIPIRPASLIKEDYTHMLRKMEEKARKNGWMEEFKETKTYQEIAEILKRLETFRLKKAICLK